jgi:hypothetical protein
LELWAVQINSGLALRPRCCVETVAGCATAIDLNTIEAHVYSAQVTPLSSSEAWIEPQTRFAGRVQFFINPEKLCPLGLMKVPLCLQLCPALAHAAADVGKFFLQRATADEQLAFGPGAPASLAPAYDRPVTPRL